MTRLVERSLPFPSATRYHVELNDRVLRIERQVNTLSEGYVHGAHNAVSSVPNSGLHFQGDFIRAKGQAEITTPGAGEYKSASFRWISPSTNSTFFTASRACTVKSITARINAPGTDAGAVTAIVRKVPSGTAITAGTALHTGSINLKGTANTNQTLTLSGTPADLDLAVGNSIGIEFTGVTTAAEGSVTVTIDLKGRYVVVGWYCVASGTPGTWVECRCLTGN